MNIPRQSSRPRAVAGFRAVWVSACFTALLTASASAATDTWNGSASSVWGAPANWTPNTVPGTLGASAAATGTTNTDTAVFTGAATSLTPTLDQFYNLQNITFGSTDGTASTAGTAAAYTIGNGTALTAGVVASGNAFVLTSGGAISNFDTQTTGVVNETINVPLTLATGAYTFNGSGAGLSSTVNNFLVVNGTVTGGAGGASALTLTGTDYVPYSNTNVNAPTLGTTPAFSNQITGAIANGAGGTTGLTISGSSWSLLGNNTYTGGTTINGGSVFINSSTSLGASTAANAIAFTGLGGTIFQANATGVTLGQNISIASGATATLSTGNTTTLTGLLSGSGAFVRMGAGTTILNNAANSFSGGIAFNGTGQAIAGANSVVNFSVDSALGTGSIAFNGSGQLTAGATVALGTGHGALPVAAGGTAAFSANGAAVTFTVPNAIVGVGSVTTLGTGVTVLSGANNFLGTTSINGGTLRAGAANVLSLGTLAAQTAGSTLDLNGFSQYTGQLNGVNNNIAGTTILNNGAAAATLTINENAGGSTYGGLINNGTGILGLTKMGTGQLTLVQTNTYTGATTVNQGALLLNFAPSAVVATPPTSNIVNSSSALSLGGGTLTVNGLTGATNAQTFNGTTLNLGQSTISAIAGSTAGTTTGTNATGTSTVNLGAIARNLGSTANFTLTAGTAGNAAITTTSGAGGGTLLTDAKGAAYATVGSIDWAATTGAGPAFNVVGGSSVSGFYTTSTTTSLAGNADVASGSSVALSSNTNIASLRYNGATATNITLGSGVTLTTGGILGTTNIISGNNPSINGGTLTGPAGGDLPILLYAAGSIGINSLITNNGAAAMGVTRGGTGGNINLNGLNTYTGVTTVTGGALNANTLFNGGLASSFGMSSNDAANLVLNGGSISLNALPGTNANGVTDRLFNVGVNGGTISSGISGATGQGTVLNFTNTGAIGFNGQIGARTLSLAGNSTQVNTLAPELDDNVGPSSLSKVGSNGASTAIWRVTGTNRYSGTTSIAGGAGSLQAGTSFVQGTGAAGTALAPTNSGGAVIGSSSLGNGTAALTLTPSTTFNATIDLFGTNQVVGALSGTTSGAFAGVVTNTAATASSLTVGNGTNANSTFTGTIVDGTGGVSLTKNGLNVAGLTSVQIIPTVAGATTTGATGYLSSTYYGAPTTISAGGALTLSGANTYTGTTTVSGGTLVLDSAGSTTARLTGTSGIIINNGGTLLLANSVATTTSGINGTTASIDRINNAANVTINGGGRFSTGGVSEGASAVGSTVGIGMLTLTANTATLPANLDFGAGANGSTLLFASLNTTSAGQYASILNWTGTIGADGGATGSDRLLFMNASGLTAAQLANIEFFGDSGQALGTGATEISFNGFTELVPATAAVPEPATWVGALLGFCAIVWSKRRQINAKLVPVVLAQLTGRV